MTARVSINDLTSDQLDALHDRLKAAEGAVQRLDQMATAWAQQLPDTIRTATAVEAIHAVTRRACPELTPNTREETTR